MFALTGCARPDPRARDSNAPAPLPVASAPPVTPAAPTTADCAAGDANGFPIESGDFAMTASWGVRLPGSFKRRFEDGSFVFWRPGVTAWISVTEGGAGKSREARFKGLRALASPRGFDWIEEREGIDIRYSFRLDEASQDARVASFNGWVTGEEGQVQRAVYFNEERDVATALQIWRGIHSRGPVRPARH